MKAAVLYEPKTRMPVVDLDQSPPRAGEVKVQMGAAGVCASDHHVMIGTANFPTPIVLGHEGAGWVDELGDGVTFRFTWTTLHSFVRPGLWALPVMPVRAA